MNFVVLAIFVAMFLSFAAVCAFLFADKGGHWTERIFFLILTLASLYFGLQILYYLIKKIFC